jgi:hypothetical protein
MANVRVGARVGVGPEDTRTIRLDTNEEQIRDLRAYMITQLIDPAMITALSPNQVAEILDTTTPRAPLSEGDSESQLQVEALRLLWPDLLSTHHWVEWDLIEAYGIRSKVGEMTYLVLFRDSDDREWAQYG